MPSAAISRCWSAASTAATSSPVIHPHLHLEPLTPQERAALLRSIIAAERAHLAEGHPSYYTVILAAKTARGAANPEQDAAPPSGRTV